MGSEGRKERKAEERGWRGRRGEEREERGERRGKWERGGKGRGGEKRKGRRGGGRGEWGGKVKMMIVQMPQQVMINEHWTEGKRRHNCVCKSKLIGVLYLLMITIFCNPISELAYQGIH